LKKEAKNLLEPIGAKGSKRGSAFHSDHVLYQVALRLTYAPSRPKARLGEESKQFFFEKKNQKTFVYKAFALPNRVGQMGKSFCFFFQKEVLSRCRCVRLKATWY
jgi:hypothetical protein